MLCVHVGVRGCSGTRVDVYMEVDAECLPQLLSTFFGESESLTEPEALQFLLGQLTISSRDPLILPLPHSQGNTHVPAMLSFYMGPNSGPPACVEPASQLPSP